MQIVNRLVTVIVALVLLVGAVIGVIEILAGGVVGASGIFGSKLGRSPLLFNYTPIGEFLRTRAWEHDAVRVILVGLALLGLLLLILAWLKDRTSDVPLGTTGGGVQTSATRRSVEQMLVASAEGQDGVSSASAKVSSRSAQVQAVTRLREPPADLSDRVAGAAASRLESLDLARPLRLRVDVARKDS